MFPAGQTVMLQSRTRSGTDAHGNDTWSTTESDIEGCAVWPASSTETVQGQDVVTDSVMVAVPVETVVAATDRLVIGGLTYEVEANADDYTSPLTGWAPGLVVRAKRVT